MYRFIRSNLKPVTNTFLQIVLFVMNIGIIIIPIFELGLLDKDFGKDNDISIRNSSVKHSSVLLHHLEPNNFQKGNAAGLTKTPSSHSLNSLYLSRYDLSLSFIRINEIIIGLVL